MLQIGIRFFLFFLLLSLCSCRPYYISVMQKWVDERYLASTHVGTPDPRQEVPSIGQMLVVQWCVPSEILALNPIAILDLIFWDHTEQRICFPITRKLNYGYYRLFDQEYEEKGGILTYKATILTEDGCVYKECKHQLWVNLIKIEDN